MKLENWSITVGPEVTAYTPPELASQRLHGKVYGHKNHDNGAEVTTSPIIGIEGETVKTRSGSNYELGGIDPDYESAYPKARERLLANGLQPQ